MCYLDFCLKRKTLFLKVNNQSLKLPSFNYDMEFSSVQKFFHRTFSPSRNNLKRNLDFFPPYRSCHTIPQSPPPTCWRPRTHSLWLAQRWTLLPEFPTRISLLQSNPLSCRPWWDQQRPGVRLWCHKWGAESARWWRAGQGYTPRTRPRTTNNPRSGTSFIFLILRSRLCRRGSAASPLWSWNTKCLILISILLGLWSRR